MIDYESATKVTIAVLGVIAGGMGYFGKKHEDKAKAGDSDEELSLEWIQEQFVKVEAERDAALKDHQDCGKEREEVKAKSFEYVVVLLDIIRRLCYMLAVSDSSRAEINKREIMTVIKYREFDGKAALLEELAEIFGIMPAEIPPPRSIPAAVVPAGKGKH